MADQRIPWDKFQEKYLSENIGYKDQARQVLIDKIGFEPDLRISIDAELSIRRALNKLDKQHINAVQFDGLVDAMSKTVISLSKRSNIH